MDESKESTDIDEDTPNEENEEQSPGVLQAPASANEPEGKNFEGNDVHAPVAHFEDEPVPAPEPVAADYEWTGFSSLSKKGKKKKTAQNVWPDE